MSWDEARRCEGCLAMQYATARVVVMVDGATRVEWTLCRACLAELLDQAHASVRNARHVW